jgi:hypothetical protein
VLLGVEHTVLESVDLEIGPDGGERVVARVRPAKRQQLRCPHCLRTRRRADATAVAELLRSSWRAVTGIITRVVDQARGRSTASAH